MHARTHPPTHLPTHPPTHPPTHASSARTGQALRALFPEWQTLWEEGSCSSPAPLPGQDVEEEQMTQVAQETHEREEGRDDGKNEGRGIESEETRETLEDSDASAEWEHV